VLGKFLLQAVQELRKLVAPLCACSWDRARGPPRRALCAEAHRLAGLRLRASRRMASAGRRDQNL